MVMSNQLNPGMTISISNKLFRVESCVKVTVPKGAPFIKTKLRDLTSNELIEKNFKVNQSIKDVNLAERRLEFLYLEGKDYLFIDIETLDNVLIPQHIIGNSINYLKEGVEVKAFFFGDTIFAVELPQFLELMVAKVEGADNKSILANASKTATLETGAKLEVPPFIEAGDIIKIDTRSYEYIQRV